MLIALLLAGAQAQSADLMARAATRLTVADESITVPNDDRLGGDAGAEGPDAKARALGTTGTPCSLVGARVCTKPPRTWLRAPLTR